MRRRNYHRMARGLGWVVVVVAAAIGAAALLWLVHFRARPVLVSTADVQPEPVAAVVADGLTGVVSARRRVVLRADAGGRVVHVAVERGSRVRRGEVLVTLAIAGAARDLNMRLRNVDAAQARQREACAAAELAGRILASERELSHEEMIARGVVEAAESRREAAAAACKSAIAAVEFARTSVALARNALGRATTVRAPFDGVVSAVRVAPGEELVPAAGARRRPELLEIIDTGSIYLLVPASEAAAGVVKAGMPVRITTASAVGPFTGRVTAVRVGDAEEGAEPLTFDVAFDDAAFAATLLPGATAEVSVLVVEGR